jgi:hypothetical protein
MAHGRIEMSSAEQLVELRKARDRYKALADRFREEGDALASRFESEGDPIIVMQEKLRHERDARRIANAYEKSIANVEASSEAMQQSQSTRRGARNIGTRLAVLALFLAAAAAVLVVGYPGIYRLALAYLPDNWTRAKHTASAPTLIDTNVRVPPVAVAPPAAEKEQPQARLPNHVPAPPSVPSERPAAAKTDRAAKAPDSAIRGEDGFWAKTLQPDGTFKDQYFSAKPRR